MRAWTDARALFRQPITRCRLVIVTTGAFVLLYALSVFGYVLHSPEIGLRCACAPIINHVDDSFAYIHGSEPAPQVGDTITQLGSQKVETWPELLRAQVNLRREPVEADYPSLDDFGAAVGAGARAAMSAQTEAPRKSSRPPNVTNGCGAEASCSTG